MLSSFYNSSSVEVQLSECFSHPTSFSTFEELLLNSSREFVLLKFSNGNKPGSIIVKTACTHIMLRLLKREHHFLHENIV